MKRSRIVYLALVISLFWEPVLTNPDTPEKGKKDLELDAQYFSIEFFSSESVNEHPLTRDGWTLSLEEGWATPHGEQEGDLTIKKPVKYLAKDIYESVKSLASSEGKLIWPGFDPSRYIELRRDESDGTSYLALSNELEKSDPEFMITIRERDIQKQSLTENLNLVIHEAFHCFQHDPERIGAEWRRESPRLIFRYGAIKANDFTLFCIEAQLLWDALFAPDDESCRTAARQFIAVRRHRQAQMAPELVEFEKGAEANEGIATYVGVQAVKIGIKAQERINLPLYESHPEKWIDSKLSSLEKMCELAGDIRRRFYYTGAAQAFILDRLSPGWKKRVQTEAVALQDLIAEVLDAEEENDASIAGDVITQKGFNTLLKTIMDTQKKALVKSRAMADSILNFSGWKIIIDLKEFGHLASQFNFAPNRVLIVDKHTRIHEIFLRVWEEGSFQALFSKSVVEDEAILRYCSHAEPGEIPNVILDGKNLTLEQPGHFPVKKEATVSADRISLSLEAGTIIIKDKTLFLQVTPNKNN